MGFEDVGVRLIAENEAQFNRAMASAQKSVENTGAATKKQASSLKQFSDGFEKLTGVSLASAVSMAGLGLAINAAFDYAKKAIKDASDLNETVSKSQVVFGDSAAEIEAFGSTAATALGMSKNEAISAAATYGNLFVSMGMSKPAAADMSKGLVQLAADLGSFNNMASTDVLEKLRAGLTGETEPLKSLGINLNAATVEAQAMKMGFEKVDGQLTASAKAQATYALILKQTQTAQGDFARTSDGAANQTKILQAKMEDLSASIGTTLLPAYVELLHAMNQVATAFAQAFEIATGFKTVLKQHEREVFKTSSTYKEYGLEILRANLASKGIIKTYDEIEKALGQTGETLDETVSSVGGLTSALYSSEKAAGVAKKMMEGYNASQAALTAETDALKLATDNAAAASLHAGDMYTAMAKAYEDKRVAEAKNALDLVTGSMTKLTTAAIFQKAAMNMSAEAALNLGVSLGVVDRASYDATVQMDLWKQQLEKGEITQERYNQLVADLAKSWQSIESKDVKMNITLAYKTTGLMPGQQPVVDPNHPERFASGGAYQIPAGYNENWPVGPNMYAGSGETVLVIPKGKNIFDVISGRIPSMSSMSAGPSNYNYSNTSNYNLNLSTSQSPQVVRNSFAMMKMLAG